MAKKANIVDVDMMKNWYEKDSKLYNSFNRYGITKDSLVGFIGHNGYYRFIFKGKYYLTHRILYQFYHNVILGETDIIDHINGIRSDNRIENLRVCDNSQNICNSKVPKNNLSTGLKNISIHKNNSGTEYYRIKIHKNGKDVFRKEYKKDKHTLEEIIKIRDEELLKHHGEFYNFG